MVAARDGFGPRDGATPLRLGHRGYPAQAGPRGSPFQMPTRLADGLELESTPAWMDRAFAPEAARFPPLLRFPRSPVVLCPREWEKVAEGRMRAVGVGTNPVEWCQAEFRPEEWPDPCHPRNPWLKTPRPASASAPSAPARSSLPRFIFVSPGCLVPVPALVAPKRSEGGFPISALVFRG